MNLTEVFEAECRAKVGHVHALIADPGRDPTYADFVELYPATTTGRVEAARAAGFGGPGDHRPNTQAWTRRRTFMRQLQRYQTGATERRKPRATKKMQGVVRSQWKKRARPGTVRAVLRLIRRYGATVTAVELAFSYEPDRFRQLDRFAVGLTPHLLARSGFTAALVEGQPIPWAALADAFLLAFGRAYGMGDYAGGGSDDVEVLSFRLGFTDRAQYGFGVRSRPKGAKRATGNKYRGVA